MTPRARPRRTPPRVAPAPGGGAARRHVRGAGPRTCPGAGAGGQRDGRPPIGPAFSVRFHDELRDLVDGAADAAGQSRAEWLRQAAEEKLGLAGRPELEAFVEWMINEQVEPSEIGRVVEKPWAYTDWLVIFRRGGSLDELDDVPAGIVVDEAVLEGLRTC